MHITNHNALIQHICGIISQCAYAYYMDSGLILVSFTMSSSLQIELIDRVDDIYRTTNWNADFKGYGVQINQVCSVRLRIIQCNLFIFVHWSDRANCCNTLWNCKMHFRTSFGLEENLLPLPG